jgi:hypothetical protein
MLPLFLCAIAAVAVWLFEDAWDVELEGLTMPELRRRASRTEQAFLRDCRRACGLCFPFGGTQCGDSCTARCLLPGGDASELEKQPWSLAECSIFALFIGLRPGFGHTVPESFGARAATLALCVLGVPAFRVFLRKSTLLLTRRVYGPIADEVGGVCCRCAKPADAGNSTPSPNTDDAGRGIRGSGDRRGVNRRASASKQVGSAARSVEEKGGKGANQRGGFQRDGPDSKATTPAAAAPPPQQSARLCHWIVAVAGAASAFGASFAFTVVREADQPEISGRTNTWVDALYWNVNAGYSIGLGDLVPASMDTFGSDLSAAYRGDAARESPPSIIGWVLVFVLILHVDMIVQASMWNAYGSAWGAVRLLTERREQKPDASEGGRRASLEMARLAHSSIGSVETPRSALSVGQPRRLAPTMRGALGPRSAKIPYLGDRAPGQTARGAVRLNAHTRHPSASENESKRGHASPSRKSVQNPLHTYGEHKIVV